MKIKILLICMICCLLGLYGCNKADSDKNNVNDIENIENTLDTENTDTEIMKPVIITPGYSEISVNQIGDYNFDYINYNEFSKQTNEIGCITLEDNESNLKATLNFIDSKVKPIGFERDYVEFDNLDGMYFVAGKAEDYSNSYETVDCKEIQDIVGSSAKVVVYKISNGYKATVEYPELTWYIYSSAGDAGEYEEAFSALKNRVAYICETYIESAPTSIQFVRNTLNNLYFNCVKFDFTKKYLDNLEYIKYNYDGSVNFIGSLSIKDYDNQQWINLNIADTDIGPISYKIQTLKDNTTKLYEIDTQYKKIRVYKDKEGKTYTLGFIQDDTEYLLDATTNMSLEELTNLFNEIIIE